MKLTLAAATLLVAFGTSNVMAAETCGADAKALQPEVDKLTDVAKKTKVQKIVDKAIEEATVEMDENECIDMLKDAKAELGIN